MMTEKADDAHSTPMPRFQALRRVPERYRSVLPLKVMKKYQCLVVGGAPGVLTVAIADRGDMGALDVLRRLTGQDIFPVWVHPGRVRLLIDRIERRRCGRYDVIKRLRPIPPKLWGGVDAITLLLRTSKG